MINSNNNGNMFGSLIPRLKRVFVEPQIYALVLESRRGSILHLGVHYSLDEAVAAATPSLLSLAPHKPGDSVGVELWTTLRGQDAITALIDPNSVRANVQTQVSVPQHKQRKITINKEEKLSAKDQVKKIKQAKNDLMASLIKQGDPNAVEVTSSRSILSKQERKFVIEKIDGNTSTQDK